MEKSGKNSTFWTLFIATFCICEAKTNLLRRSDIDTSELTSAISNSGDLIAHKLDQIVTALHLSNQKTVDSNYLYLMERLKEQDRQFQALEAKIENLNSKMANLETQLNLTTQENTDLRIQMDVLRDTLSSSTTENPGTLHTSYSPSTETPGTLIRNPRNFKPTSNFFPTVAFDAYRNKPFDTEQATITYDGTTVNVGHAFNTTTGVFTTPIPGVYSFNFHALTRDGTATYIKIMLNERNVGGAYRRHEGEGDESHGSQSSGLSKAEGMLAQAVVLDLEQGDRVSVFAYHGNIRDGGWHYTHFTGFRLP